MRLKSTGRLCLLAALAGCHPGGPSSDPAIQTVYPRWTNQYRTPTSSHLRAVAFLDALTGYVAGEATSIFLTRDGGVTWTQMEHSPGQWGGDVAAMDLVFDGVTLNVGTAGADAAGGGRWWTSGDGLNFATPDVASTGFAAFTSMDLVAPGVAYYLATDGVIRHVTPSTVTAFSVGAAGPWHAVEFIGLSGIGYVAGAGGAIRKTATNGATWGPLASGTGNTLRDISFPGALDGFVCGDAGTVLRTSDGAMWSDASIAGGPTLRALSFVSSTTGWVVGNGGFIRYTTTGGASWNTPATVATAVDLYDVWFVNASVGYAVGDDGTVVKSVDGGANWTNLTQGSLVQLNAVDFTSNGLKGMAVGNGGVILRTLDGGASWTPSASGVVVDLYSVSVPDTGSGNVAYACGPGVILKTLDFGATTWSPMGAPAATYRSIRFASGDTLGLCVGDGSAVLRTGDGATWSAPGLAPPAGNYKAAGSPAGGLTAFAGGDAGVVGYTSDSGVSWSDQSIATTANVVSMAAPAFSTAFAGADDGAVYRKLLLASPWQATTPDPAPGAIPYGLAFTSSTNGWAATGGAGVKGSIFLTSDSGTVWAGSPEHTHSTLRAVWMSGGATVGYAVGDNGTILKTVTGGR